LRNDLGVDLDERDYAKNPLSEAEISALFDDAALDPRDFLNPRSPAYKTMGLGDRKLTAAEAVRLMARDLNLIKRPLVFVGKTVIAGFDRDRLRAALISRDSN
jgi:arsenate reductase-like glutaredoxin family protein